MRAAGHDAIVMPLFAIEHLPVHRVSATDYDAIILTSGNAVRAAAEFLTGTHGLPIYAVGSATAKALELLCLPVTKTGSDGVEALVQFAAADGHKRVLWLAGEDHSIIPQVAGVTIDVEIVYRSCAIDMPKAFDREVIQSDATILHSSRAAAYFGILCDAANLRRDRITIATFSAAIAQSAGEDWAARIVADTPNDAALLEAIQTHFKVAHDAT